MKQFIVAILFAFLLMPIIGAAPALADRCTRMLSRLQGYTIISVTQVNGEFQGCDFGKVIRFMDGTALKCSSYSYTYSYMPDAVIFGKTMTHQGKSFAIIKALIEGEIFDMEPVILGK